MTEQEYRGEIRRQILEGKMLQLRVKGRVQSTEALGDVVYDLYTWSGHERARGIKDLIGPPGYASLHETGCSVLICEPQNVL